MAVSKKEPKFKPPKKRKDAIGGFNAMGYPCPVVGSCCYLPVKIGTYIIALLGILPTVACIVLATPAGIDILHENGLPQWYVPGIKWAYSLLGILVFTSHIIIAVAVKLGSRKCIILYLWALLVYMAGSFGIAVVISAKIMMAGNTSFGIVFLLLASMYTLMLLYFWIVVNSLLYLEEEKSRVINIHITIL